MESVRRHEVAILKYALDMLREIPGLTVYGPTRADRRGGVISFNVGDIHPHDLATLLDMEGIATRSGHHCAQPLMRWLDVAATSRASFSVYNANDDIDALCAGIRKAREVFKI